MRINLEYPSPNPAQPLTYTATLARMRGDTCPHEFTLVDDTATPIDITGYGAIEMSIDTAQNPPGSGVSPTNVAIITATVTAALSGEFEFEPTALDADQDPLTPYFYDIQLTDPGGRTCTLAKGRYRFYQDITK